ncbi:MAG TPA: hypothetical protein VIM79_25515, partial [Niastella sp.]
DIMAHPKFHIIASAFLFTLLSCTQHSRLKKGPTDDTNDYKPVSAKELTDKLETAYTRKADDKLGQFFADWNTNVPPNSKKFIEQNDTINALFDAYKAFYQPLDLLKLGDWEWGNELNAGSKYVVINNTISYMVTNSFEHFDWQNPNMREIGDFRPPTTIDSKKVLYLTPEYDSTLRQFLGTESTEAGEPNIMNPARPKGESEKRYKTLRPYIPILHGHWNGWHLNTHPSVSYLLLNKDLTQAHINFRVGYQGGEATLKKDGNSWTIKESKATWIE